MGVFIQVTTVIGSITVKKANGTLFDPADSMEIEVHRLRPNFSIVTSATAMDKDSTGTYHFDFQTANQENGDYRFVYIATDGTRISKGDDFFRVAE